VKHNPATAVVQRLQCCNSVAGSGTPPACRGEGFCLKVKATDEVVLGFSVDKDWICKTTDMGRYRRRSIYTLAVVADSPWL